MLSYPYRSWGKYRDLGRLILWSFWIACVLATPAAGAATAVITGKVTHAQTGEPLHKVNVILLNTGLGDATSPSGEYTINNVPPGVYRLRFSAVGFKNVEVADIVVSDGVPVKLDVALEVEVITLTNVSVYGASRREERITAVPAAVSVVAPSLMQQLSGTGQLPKLLEHLTGVDIVQNGINDFNLNARGFNSSLTRRVVVLLDHRETAATFLGVQEWNTITFPNADLGKVEFIRGPSSALYGANAFSGILNVTTPAPKDIVGTRVSVAGGEFNSMRGDVRHAGVSGRWSYKFNFGGMRSDNWARSRNISQEALDARDYPGLAPELFPLGDNDISSVFANLRVDYALAQKGTITAEGGINQAQDQVFVTGLGRVQVDEVVRPWWRVAFRSENTFSQLDYTGRKTIGGHQRALNTGTVFKEDSYDLRWQLQHHLFPSDDLRLTLGVEQKVQYVSTDQTLTPDAYHESHTALFAHAKYEMGDRWAVIAAARVDGSSLHPLQVSPKAALIYSPRENHALRIAVNRAFQTANFAEFFLRAPAGVPQDLLITEQRIERTLEAQLGLQPRTLDLPLNFDFTPFLAVGNRNLDVEKIVGFEVGYRGVFADRLALTADVYLNRLTDFITDLLPGVNPDYPRYQLPAGIDPEMAPLVQEALERELGENFPLLAETPEGRYAFVLSYGNAGSVDVYGVELGLNYRLSEALAVDANYTYFNFNVRSQAEGDVLLPNTPRHKFNVGMLYDAAGRVEAAVNVRYVDGYRWAAGIFDGRVPAYALLNASGGVWVLKDVRVGLIVANLLDNKHYQMFGGSVNGRRALLSATVLF